MPETSYHTADGRTKIYVSNKPFGFTTYFAGASDDAGISNGERILFNLSANDQSQTVTLTFVEDIYIKDGYMIIENAPFGAYIDFDVLLPNNVPVASYGKKLPLFGSSPILLNTDDTAFMPAGLKLVITVHNSDGTGVQDPPSAFKVAGWIELFRVNTV